MKKRLPQFLLLAVSLVVSLAIAELVFRAVHPETSAYSVAATGDQYRFCQYDSTLGWVNTPGVSGYFQREEFRYPVRINRFGMRQGEVEIGINPGERRVAVVGDSFVWGIGVADGERFTEILGAEFDNVEVLNFGVCGYGPVQYLLNLDQVLRFSPELVIIAFCLGNDFIDNVQSMRYGYYKPYASLDDFGVLRVLGRPVPRSTAEIFKPQPRRMGSAILGALLGFNVPEVTPGVPDGLFSMTESDMYDLGAGAGPHPGRRIAIAVNAALLAEIARRVQRAGVDLLVVSAPTKFEYNRAGRSGHEGYFDQLEQVLAASCDEFEISHLRTVHALHGDDFWMNDGHWTARGHEKLAAAIRDRLEAMGFKRLS